MQRAKLCSNAGRRRPCSMVVVPRRRCLQVLSYNRAAQARGPAAPKPSGTNKLTPEALKIYQEAQRSIIELSVSRTKALEELVQSRKRIAELESELLSAKDALKRAEDCLSNASMVREQAARTQMRSPSPPPYASRPPTPVVEVVPQRQPPMQQPPQQQKQPSITLAYYTGWSNVCLHYRMDEQGWTKVPGVRMENGTDALQGAKVLTINGSHLEFVLNNGKNDWDTPNPFNGKPENYHIRGPGVYRLKDGKIEKLA